MPPGGVRDFAADEKADERGSAAEDFIDPGRSRLLRLIVVFC
jgi:hypothetical protein